MPVIERLSPTRWLTACSEYSPVELYAKLELACPEVDLVADSDSNVARALPVPPSAIELTVVLDTSLFFNTVPVTFVRAELPFMLTADESEPDVLYCHVSAFPVDPGPSDDAEFVAPEPDFATVDVIWSLNV